MAIHVYPINDYIDHHTNDGDYNSCPCDPRVEWFDEDGTPFTEPLIIHNALDGRE